MSLKFKLEGGSSEAVGTVISWIRILLGGVTAVALAAANVATAQPKSASDDSDPYYSDEYDAYEACVRTHGPAYNTTTTNGRFRRRSKSLRFSDVSVRRK